MTSTSNAAVVDSSAKPSASSPVASRVASNPAMTGPHGPLSHGAPGTGLNPKVKL